MSIKESYYDYFKKYGFVTNGDETCDNGVRFTTEFLFVLDKYGELDQDTVDFNRELFNSCEMRPGLLRRTPEMVNDQEGPDNNYAAIAADVLLDTGYAKRFLEYGETTRVTEVDYESEWGQRPINLKWGKLMLSILKFFKLNKYIYNTVIPGKFNFSAWYGRQMPMIAHAKLVVAKKEKRKLPLFWRLTWCVGVCLSGKSLDQDGKVLCWFMIKASEGVRSWIMRRFANYWSKKLKEQYPHGIGDVLNHYFGDKNQPSIKCLWDEFGYE